jgi:hypothetical protein
MTIPKDPEKAALWRKRQSKAQKGKSRNKGEDNPFFGKHHTDEVKALIRRKVKGQKRPPRSKEWCKRIALAKKGKKGPEENFGIYLTPGKRPWVKIDNNGKNNPRWKGGITPENKRIRNSPEMIEWRNRVFERDKYICQFCGFDRGHIIRAHHIFPFMKYPDLRFEIENGTTLCEKCHRDIHKKETCPIQDWICYLISTRDNLKPYWENPFEKEFLKKK